MSIFTTRFIVTAEIVVRVNADDEDEAYKEAFERATGHLATLSNASATGVEVHISIDGVGADSVWSSK